MLKKFKQKRDLQRGIKFKKRLEKELIRAFQDFTKGIKEDLITLNQSPQLLNAITLADAYRQVCDKIGEDRDQYQGLFKFINVVRQNDREIEQIIRSMKKRFDYSDSEKFRVEGKRSSEYVKGILQTLRSIQDGFIQEQAEIDLSNKQREEERTSIQNQESSNNQNGNRKKKDIQLKVADYEKFGEKAPIQLKAREYIRDKTHPEEIPENIEAIRIFRKKITADQQKNIQQPLSVKEEVQILKQTINEFDNQIQAFEKLGYYNHVKKSGKQWLLTLETLGKELSSETIDFNIRNALRGELRKNYKFIDEWLARVDVKYEIKRNINPNEPEVKEKNIEFITNQYHPTRDNYIRAQEDRRILKILASKDKGFEKELKQQETQQEIKKKQLEREIRAKEIAEEKARRAREKDLANQKKNKAKEQERKQKEQELEKQRNLQKKQKEEQAALRLEKEEKARLEKEKEKARLQQIEKERIEKARLDKEEEKVRLERIKKEKEEAKRLKQIQDEEERTRKILQEKEEKERQAALESHKQEYQEKMQAIKNNKELTKSERTQKVLDLANWHSEEEVRILTAGTGAEEPSTEEELEDLEEIRRNEELQAELDAATSKEKPRMAALKSNEIDQIWEFYFLHRYNHPTPDEFYGGDKAKQFVQQMLHQIQDIYDQYDSSKPLIETLPGSSKLYYVGDSTFEDNDKLLSRFFQPKIFESQANETPLRILFLGNFIGNNNMDLHNLLYIICFNLAYPAEVIMCRGEEEELLRMEKNGFVQNVLDHFDNEILEEFKEFFTKLPIAHVVKSTYQNVIASHGGIPANIDNPEVPVLLSDIEYTPHISAKKMDTNALQFILNQPNARLKKNSIKKIAKKKGYSFNETIFSAFMQANELITEEVNGMMVSSGNFTKDGHVLLWDNQSISIYTTSEKDDKEAKAKILEITFPADPEYPEYEYEDEEEGDAEEEEYEYEEEGDAEEGETVGDGETEYEEEEEEEVDPETLVQINVLDINNLHT